MTAAEKVWEIPKPHSIQNVVMDDGTVIVLRRHGNPSGPRIVLSHGNGLAIDLYYPFWSLFADDCDLIVYDLRNHGWNSVGSQQRHHIPSFVDDHDCILEAIDRYYGKKTKIGIFHSVSALATLLSPNCGSEFVARVLFDPPVCKPNDYLEEFDVTIRRFTELILQRANRFDSIEEYADFLRFVPSLGRTKPGVVGLFAKTTLRKSSVGESYELRCPREYEAQIMSYAKAFAVYVDLETISCPTKVIGADPTMPNSFLPTFDLSHVLTLDYDFLPDASHLLQLEQPETCASMVREFLEHHDCMNS